MSSQGISEENIQIELPPPDFVNESPVSDRKRAGGRVKIRGSNISVIVQIDDFPCPGEEYTVILHRAEWLR